LSNSGQWHDAWLWFSAIGDALIAVACIGLSLLVLKAMQRRTDLPQRSLSALAVCLLLLGVAHGLAVWDLWDLWDLWDFQTWLLVVAKDVAAVAALVSVAWSWRELPQLLSLPSREHVRRAEAALERSHEELESFMSSVSHDLRSPLTTIAGQAGLLELSLGANATDDLKRRVQRIHHSVRHMSQLIEALLALSRIARHELRPESLDISALTQQIIDEFKRREPHREVSVTIQPELRGWGDRRMVTDLLGHVLGNAWKFTARTTPARIEVGATQTAGITALYVRDNGAGFDMVYEPKLFKPFQRLHKPSEFEGAGIGLVSAARILARHGGKIWVEATPNAGAAFYFTLPQAE
jgi:signal transduction histidine kinase